MEVRVSVAMAVYNGEAYIREQIDSIVMQLHKNDELIISYNESSDNTWDIIKSYADNDCRIHVYKCSEIGIINNFNNAISLTSGKYIFLADQDDIWASNKIECVLNEFDDEVLLVQHNCSFIDALGNNIQGDLFIRRNSKPGVLKNILINGFQGSCIAFHKELKRYILPIPSNVPMHDQWIGILAGIYGKVVLLNQNLILYRRHSDAASNVHFGYFKKIKQVVTLSLKLLIRYYHNQHI